MSWLNRTGLSGVLFLALSTSWAGDGQQIYPIANQSGPSGFCECQCYPFKRGSEILGVQELKSSAGADLKSVGDRIRQDYGARAPLCLTLNFRSGDASQPTDSCNDSHRFIAANEATCYARNGETGPVGYVRSAAGTLDFASKNGRCAMSCQFTPQS